MEGKNSDHAVREFENKKMEFAIEEYKALRSEILARSNLDYTLQRNSLIACGGIYAFTFSNINKIPDFAYLLILVPLILLISFFKQIRNKAYGVKHGNYISHIEMYFYTENYEYALNGWENYLRSMRSENELKEHLDSSNTKRGGLRGIHHWIIILFKAALMLKTRTVSTTTIDNFYMSWGVITTTLIAIYFINQYTEFFLNILKLI